MLLFQVWQHCLLPPWHCRLSSWFFPCPFCYSRSGNTVYCLLDSSLVHASIPGLATLSTATLTLSTVILIRPLSILLFQVWQHCLLSSWFFPSPCFHFRSGDTVCCHFYSYGIILVAGLATCGVRHGCHFSQIHHLNVTGFEYIDLVKISWDCPF